MSAENSDHENHEPTPEGQVDPYEGMRELYASKSAEERAEMMLHAVSKAQVEAMLSVERNEVGETEELTPDGEPEQTEQDPATKRQAEKQTFLDSLKGHSPEQHQQILDEDTEEAWRTYERAEEQAREEAIDQARETIVRAEKAGATFSGLDRRKVVDREISKARVQKEHLEAQAPKSERIKPPLALGILQRVEKSIDRVGRWLRDTSRAFSRKILRRP